MSPRPSQKKTPASARGRAAPAPSAAPGSVRARYARLRQEIERHRRLYYIENAPEIGDAEYDALEAVLRRLEEQYPDLRAPDSPSMTVGGEPAPGLATVRHRVPMLSLENAYTETEVRDWEGRLRRALDLPAGAPLEYVGELKIDGLSVSLLYERGEFTQGLTRGDGRVGEDVTANIRAVRSIPQRLEGAPARLEVRGEVFFPLSEFRRLNEARQEAGLPAFANPRNAAAGSIRLLDPQQTAQRRLDAFLYQIVEGAPRRHREALLEHLLAQRSGFDDRRRLPARGRLPDPLRHHWPSGLGVARQQRRSTVLQRRCRQPPRSARLAGGGLLRHLLLRTDPSRRRF